MEKLREIIFKRVPVRMWLIIFVILGGVFLRTYNHAEWLRFNADQARDASITNNVLEGKSTWPLLGPKAGGTEFKLGPAFYYFQIVVAKIFDGAPDKLAYPDLIFSILSIPLLYLLLKKYFSKNISLAMMTLSAVSMFAIQYARFAWNPNASPFFVLLFLYALLELSTSEKKQKIIWVIGAGLALGIGVQLHTFLLASMPIVALVFLGYLYKKHKIVWLHAGLLMVVALGVNAPQFVHESKTGGANISAFLHGASSKTSRGDSFWDKAINDAVCQTQANAYIISAKGDDDQCGIHVATDMYKKAHGSAKKILLFLELASGALFSLGGFVLWFNALRKEQEEKKQEFLGLLGIYTLLGFVLVLPVAMEVSLRYYLAWEFVPFVLLGFWIAAIEKRGRKYEKTTAWLLGILLTLLVASNLLAVSSAFAAASGKKEIKGSTAAEITLGEAQFLAKFISENAEGSRTVYIKGRHRYLFKYLRPLGYFTGQKHLRLLEFPKKKVLPADAVVFSLVNAKQKGKLPASMADQFVAKKYAAHGRFGIFLLGQK